MAKLTGKAKTKFLARINKGRKAKGLKPIRSKTKSTPKKRGKQGISKRKSKNRTKSATKQRKTNKRKASKNNNNMAKKKRMSRKSLVGSKLKNGAIGGFVGVATTAVAKRLGATSVADDLGYVVASIAGKGTPGVIGNAVIRQGLGRFGGSLNFLGNGNGGNGNGVNNTLGFA